MLNRRNLFGALAAAVCLPSAAPSRLRTLLDAKMLADFPSSLGLLPIPYRSADHLAELMARVIAEAEPNIMRELDALTCTRAMS